MSEDELQSALLEIANSSVYALDELWTVSDSSGDQVSLLDTIADEGAADPQEALARNEVKDRLTEAIGSLPEREQLVVALYYYENLTLREIGEVLGVTESRVSQLHTKAVMRLKSHLQQGLRACAAPRHGKREHLPASALNAPVTGATRPPAGPGRSGREREPSSLGRFERAATRFNASEAGRTVAGLARTLGRPRSRSAPRPGAPDEVRITVAWELTWYQWGVDLGEEVRPVFELAKGVELSEIDAAARSGTPRRSRAAGSSSPPRPAATRERSP